MNLSVCPRPGATADPAESPAGNKVVCAVSSRVACSQSNPAPPLPAFRNLKEEKGPGSAPPPAPPETGQPELFTPQHRHQEEGATKVSAREGEPDTIRSVLLPQPPPKMCIARFTITRWRPQACRPPHPVTSRKHKRGQSPGPTATPPLRGGGRGGPLQVIQPLAWGGGGE